jgi:hypothetical protein
MSTIRRSDGSHPLCSCGAAVKKDYNAPVFTYPDFLRAEEPVLAEHGAQDVPED